MKRIFSLSALALGTLVPGLLPAAPVTVPNFSFEQPVLAAGGWSNALNSWTGSGGNNSNQAFIEYINAFSAQGTQHLGMELGYDVWQDLSGETFQPNMLYTLTVAVGNRNATYTLASNSSVYALADTTGVVAASGSLNASTLPASSFGNGIPVALDTYADPCIIGKSLRILLQARGGGRSHFENIRLDATASTPGGRPAATLSAATSIGSTTATLNGTITDQGSAAPSVIFYYDTADRGGMVASWTSNVAVAGTQTGAFSAGATGLQPNTTYYFRARASNASGDVWAAPCLSFTTLPAAPTVENVAATTIGGSSAVVGANVTGTGGQAPDVTIYYGPANGGTTAGSWASSVMIPALTGSATRPLTGLTSGTVYYFRSYAQNGAGSDWADSSASFTTATVTLPVVENRAADNITGTSAVLAGEVVATGNDPPVVTLFWGTTDGQTNAAAWTNSRVLGPDAGDFSSMVQGLTPLTTHYYTSRATNAAGTAWATPSRSFTTGSALPTSVIINEIHYDPADPTKAQEFIEFYNPTAASIDMSNWLIDTGVTYAFPPGTTIPASGYKVVAQNVAAFTVGFPAAGTPLGPWTGVLGNKGEVIRLKNAAGVVVDEADYRAGFPWPTAAKGGGVSAELIHPSLNNDLGGNWRGGFVPTGATYVPFASQWRWRRGVVGDTGETAAQFTAWRTLGFTEPAPPAADAQWATNTIPIGYGENDGVTGETENTTPLPDMLQGGTLPDYTSIYLRKVFTIPAGQMPTHLQVRARVDDGCIVWINGVYVGAIRNNTGIGTGHHYYNTLAVNAPEPPPVEVLPIVTAAAVNLVEGDNIIAVHAMNTTANSSDFFIDVQVTQSFGSSVGVTPNAPNTNLAATGSVPPPAIRNVDHTPAMPVAGDPVIVTALITDPDNVGAVSLSYQAVSPGTYIRLQDAAYTNPANWTTVAMNDAGTGGDAVAGDAVFSATIPASVQSHRRLVRYKITAADALTNSVSVPYPDDEQPNFAYFVYNGVPGWTGAFRPTAFGGFPATAAQTFPASLIGSIEPYHLIALDTDVALCLYTGPTDSTPYRGTLVYEGKVYDHITFNIRGIGSTRVSGKNKLTFKFNRTRDFQARDNWGRQYDEDWNSFGMDANASPWAAVHRGSAGVEDALSYRIFELGGMVSLRTHYAHLRIVRKAAESAPAGTPLADTTAGGTVDGQYTSDLWGLYMVLEPTEANLLDERNLPDGNIYAIEGNNGDKKHQSTGQVSDGSDWVNFRNQLAQAGQTEAWYRGNLDLNQLYTYIALSRLVGNVDIRPGDNYRFYHNPTVLDPAYPGGHWSIMGYDHDMQFIAATHWGGTMDGQVVGGAPFAVLAMMRHPNIARDYRNRCREILSLMGSDGGAVGGQIGQLIDEYSQMVNPTGATQTWADVDANLWNLHPRSAGGGGNTGQSSHRGNFYRGLYLDGTRGGLGGTVQTANYRRELLPGGVDGTADHEAIMSWFGRYSTNTYPPATAWTRKATNAGTGFGGAGADSSVNRQKGYGWKYLEWECLYGGYFNCNVNPTAGTATGDLTAPGTTRYAVNGDSLADLSAADNVLYPDKPVITYTGTAGYPVNDIRLHSSDYTDPQGDATITAVQWRVGEISAPGIPLYDPTVPRIYELEELWRSAEIPTASPTGIPDVRVPTSVLRAGHTYRARVRHMDDTGRWSFWSEPLQFVTGNPDVSAYTAALRISEINYHPGPVTPAEISAPGWNVLWNDEDLEFIEVRNVSGAVMDLTDVRFTKGIDFDFPPAFSLAAGASAVIVKNPAAFAIRYPGVTPAGTYGAANLANGGEEVKLSYGAGAAIIEFTYSDTAPWPETPDGGGPTLVLKTPAKPGLDHGDPYEWRASSSPNGTPGTGDGTTYATWAAGYAGIFGPDADDDNDGYNNRLEYALAGNPQSAVPNRTPTASFSEVGALTCATLTFTRRSDAVEASVSVEFSDELMTWTLPGVLISSTDNGDGTTTEIWRSADPVSTQSRLFGRVLITTFP